MVPGSSIETLGHSLLEHGRLLLTGSNSRPAWAPLLSCGRSAVRGAAPSHSPAGVGGATW